MQSQMVMLLAGAFVYYWCLSNMQAQDVLWYYCALNLILKITASLVIDPVHNDANIALMALLTHAMFTVPSLVLLISLAPLQIASLTICMAQSFLLTCVYLLPHLVGLLYSKLLPQLPLEEHIYPVLAVIPLILVKMLIPD